MNMGRTDEAQVLLDELEGAATSLARPWALAAAARCRGLLRAARGDATGAVESLEEAVRHHDRLDQPFERVRTLLGLGGAERRLKQKRAAREALEEAVEIFERLGRRYGPTGPGRRSAGSGAGLPPRPSSRPRSARSPPSRLRAGRIVRWRRPCS